MSEVVAITGAGRGIGLATARALRTAAFDGQDATVVIGDIDEAAVTKAAGSLGVTGLTVDVTSRESFTAFLDKAEESAGRLDVVINNAGIMLVRIAFPGGVGGSSPTRGTAPDPVAER